VVWGALNGAYVVLDRWTEGLRRRIGKALHLPGFLTGFLGRLLTFHLVLVSWVFFRAGTIQDAWTVFTRVFANLERIPPMLSRRLGSEEMIISLVLIGLLLVIEALDEWGHFWQALRTKPVYLRWGVYYLLLILLVVFGSWQMREFVYMQF
jgi:D-alanyl-lipoteichoic acid acyltransferase DltB (MBOAT superfamily)